MSDHFAQLREGHAVVRRLVELARIAKDAPSYTQGDWDPDQDDYEPEPNEGPHDHFHDALAAAWEHPAAASILRARGWSEDRGMFYRTFIWAMPTYGRTR